MPSLAVIMIGSIASTIIAWVALVLTNAPASVGAIAWGSVAGLGGGAGTLLLYRGLARGQMSVVGPVSAVGSASLPVVVGITLGERPSLVAALGVLLALPAIALVSASDSQATGALSAALTDGLGAGTGFGVMFVGLAQAGGQAGLWPIVSEQTTALVLLSVLALRSRAMLGMGIRQVGLPVVVGIAGMGATLLYFFATHSGLLSTVAIVTSLYPGVTVALARVVLHERFSTRQRAGLGLCAIAIAAIALN